jgi:hypothetical protein
MSSIEYLEEERKKIWEKISELENFIKITDLQKDSLQASKKISEYKNKSETKLDQIEKLYQVAQTYEGQVRAKSSEVENLSEQSKSNLNQIKVDTEQVQSLTDKILSLEADSKIQQFDETCEKLLEVEETVKQAEGFLQESSSLKNKIQSFHKEAHGLKEKISDLYDEIYGYETEDEETGKTTEVEGLRHKLEKSYDGLTRALQESNEAIKIFKEEFTGQCNSFLDSQEQAYSTLKNKIESLLPAALTAGLSHAYQEKRVEEENSKRFWELIFSLTIVALIIFASLPLFYLWHYSKSAPAVTSVVEDFLKLLPIMLPIYAPLTWLAISSSRKSNLSKRLIEEYTHKEVLSKTFEGLSSQIKNINEDEDSQNLKNKLLSNLISISSENPGQLIKNYNKADHPVTDFMEDRIKELNRLVSKLSDVLTKSFRDLSVKDSDSKKSEDKV